MRVKDLIEKLEEFNPEARVAAYSAENEEVFEVRGVESIKIGSLKTPSESVEIVYLKD